MDVCVLSLFLSFTTFHTTNEYLVLPFFHFEFNYKLTFERKQLYPLLSRITFIDAHTHALTNKHTHAHICIELKIKRNVVSRKQTLEINCGVFFSLLLHFRFNSLHIDFVLLLFARKISLFFLEILNEFGFTQCTKFIDEMIAPFNFVSVERFARISMHHK